MKTCSNCIYYVNNPPYFSDTSGFNYEEVCIVNPAMVYVDQRENICSLYTEKDYNYKIGV